MVSSGRARGCGARPSQPQGGGSHLTVLLYNWSPRVKQSEALLVQVVGTSGTLMTVPLTLADSSVELLDLSLP